MARPREFDEAVALDAAVQCFWSRGYEATSTRDLAESMGITGASLYNAFGDKRSLYRQALDRYIAQSIEDRVGRFETNRSPRDAIEGFFGEIIERSMRDKQRKGCMLVNSALEVAPHDAEFQQIVAGVLSQLQAFFRKCVEAGQADGTISKAHSPEDMGRMLLALLVGLRVLARACPERKILEGAVRPVFALLGTPKAARATRRRRPTKN